MKDLAGKTVRVGDKVAFAVRAFKGYLGLGEVVEILPEQPHPSRSYRWRAAFGRY